MSIEHYRFFAYDDVYQVYLYIIQVGSTHQEFDLNIVFKWNPTFCKLVNLGGDDKKKNFALLRVTKPEMTGSEKRVVFQEGGVDYISPKKVSTCLQ